MRVELLGGFRIRVDRQVVGQDAWRLRKAAALVKLLALAPGYRLQREQVLEHLWSDRNPKAAANNFRQALYVARKVLGADEGGRYLKLQGGQLALCPEERLWVDAKAFEAAAGSARRSAREPAAFRAAINLYAGDLLPEDRYEEWTMDRREALKNTYLSLLVELAEIHEERGDYDSAITVLNDAVEAGPSDQWVRVALMRAYARSGRHREALLQHVRLREVASRQTDPGLQEAVQRLYAEMLLGDPSDRPGADRSRPHVMPATPSGAGLHNLPAERTSFVGRADQRAEVERVLASTRLLTLTGTGGLGKTRLALAVANSLVGSYRDGVWLVELAPRRAPELVTQAVAQGLGVREQPGRPLFAVLKEHLSSKTLLLVLDNCEHLVDAVARLVESLLDSCPGLRVLTTSRETLNVDGELVWRVPPLTVPETCRPVAVEDLAAMESVRLFVERAALRAPSFVLEQDNARAVAEVCRKLDGLPLAIELAANRVGTLSVAQISARLEGSLRLLTGSRTAPKRQRTLEGALDWSFELLDEQEKMLFERLSVFAGSWTLESAEAVGAGASDTEDCVLELLLRLVDRSLVMVDAVPDSVRYKMLEPVRQYGRQKLEAEERANGARRRHATWFLKQAEAAELDGPQQMAWLERLETEHDDLRNALAWLAQEGETERGLRLAAALGRFWYQRGYFAEGTSWLEAFLQPSEGTIDTAARAKALYELGALINRNAGPSSDDREVARTHLMESLGIYRKLGEGPYTAVLREIGSVSIGMGDWGTARSALEEGLELGRRSGDAGDLARTYTFLGIMACLQGYHDAAQAHFEASLENLGEEGSRSDMNTNLFFLGCLACDRGDHASARSRFGEMIQGNSLHVFRWATPVVLVGYARLAAGEGRAARALRLAGAADTLRRSVGGPTGPTFVAYLRRGLEPAWQALGRKQGASAFDEGRKMSPEDALTYAFDNGEPAAVTRANPEVGPEPAILTHREREVAMLVARELSNRQIADELFVSEHTVATHVHRILGKLGLRSRTQIVAWVIGQRVSP